MAYDQRDRGDDDARADQRQREIDSSLIAKPSAIATTGFTYA